MELGSRTSRKKQKHENARLRAHERRAYKTKRPFSCIEGIGTPAWEKLDIGARGLLTEFYKKFNGYNRDNLSLTFREVKGRIASLVFQRFKWQLIGYGFLEVKRLGRLERNCSIYGLSSRWDHLSKHPDLLDRIESLVQEIDYLLRQPGSAAKRERIAALRRRVLDPALPPLPPAERPADAIDVNRLSPGDE